MVAGLLLGSILTPACSPRPPKDGRRAALEVWPRMWDFGTLQRGESKTKTISLTNHGPDTLHLSLHPTCDCLSAEPGVFGLAPGARQAVMLTYMGDEIKAPVTKTVFIDSDDPGSRRIAFAVTGDVTQGRSPHLVAVPDPLPLDASSASYPSAHLRISNRGEEPLIISEITCFGCINSWSRKELAQGEEALLEVELLSEWTDRRWLEVESNDPVQPLKRIPIIDFE